MSNTYLLNMIKVRNSFLVIKKKSNNVLEGTQTWLNKAITLNLIHGTMINLENHLHHKPLSFVFFFSILFFDSFFQVNF